MKKLKIFMAAAIVAIVSVAAGFYSYNATQENLLAQEQELVLLDENVEALTNGNEVMTVVKVTNREQYNVDCTISYKTSDGVTHYTYGHKSFCHITPKDCPPCFYHSECQQ